MLGDPSREQLARDLVRKVADHYTQSGHRMLIDTVVVHPGPKAWKEVSLLTFVDEETGEVHRRQLRAQTWKAIPAEQGGGYDFPSGAGLQHQKKRRC
jgi:hypothetical protein